MSIKTYTCICGKVCNSPASFNGHKQGCAIHIINKYGSLESYYEIKNRNHNKGQKVKQRAERYRQDVLNAWITEKHNCERCGKLMLTKYGSGRFCSVHCANSKKHTEETKRLIGESYCITLLSKNIRANNILEYNKNPVLCEVCSSPLSYDNRCNKTCSKECANELHRRFRNDYIAENGLVEFGKKGYKFGWYKGYHCDSSWELAFVMYNIDHDIHFERNNDKYFEYIYQGVKHKFFPDFIVDNKFIEIKGAESEQTDCKLKDFPEDVPFEILFYPEMKPYIDYAESTYGKEFFHLYDADKPSWMNI